MPWIPSSCSGPQSLPATQWLKGSCQLPPSQSSQSNDRHPRFCSNTSCRISHLEMHTYGSQTPPHSSPSLSPTPPEHLFCPPATSPSSVLKSCGSLPVSPSTLELTYFGHSWIFRTLAFHPSCLAHPITGEHVPNYSFCTFVLWPGA